jgi:AcrR family transcriptional regulator
MAVGDDDRPAGSDEPPSAEFAIDPDAVRQALESGRPVRLRVVGDAAPARARGRPRSHEAHLAILQAALDLLAEGGYEGLSMEAVAQRAAVSKATVYRRWPSKPALVIDLLESIAATTPKPDTGTVRGDLHAMLEIVFLALRHSQYGAVLLALASEMQRNPDIAETFRTRFLSARRAGMVAVLQRGIDRGELRPDADLELVADLLVGPLYYRMLVSGMPLSSAYAAAVVDHVLCGVESPRPADDARST